MKGNRFTTYYMRIEDVCRKMVRLIHALHLKNTETLHNTHFQYNADLT